MLWLVNAESANTPGPSARSVASTCALSPARVAVATSAEVASAGIQPNRCPGSAPASGQSWVLMSVRNCRASGPLSCADTARGVDSGSVGVFAQPATNSALTTSSAPANAPRRVQTYLVGPGAFTYCLPDPSCSCPDSRWWRRRLWLSVAEFRHFHAGAALAWFAEDVDTATVRRTGTRRGMNLALATWISTINFWAWNLIGPMSTTYAERLSLSSTQASVLVATPILVGSLGRLVSGPLTDRFGGRVMLIAVTLASIVPVLAVGIAGTMGSYPLLIVFGFFLGVAGTIFAVGIPFSNNWYEPARRGFATGVFGAGMVGTALSAFFTPRFVRWFGLMATHIIIAVALAATAAVAFAMLRDSAAFHANTEPVIPKLLAAAKLGVTWEMSLLYAVVFGGFVAFSNYLPTYIKTIYGFSPVDAGARTAAFALAAVIARPIGGALSDRIPPKYVVLTSLGGTAVMAAVAVLQPPADLWSAVTFTLLAVFLGVGTGGVFAWVARRSPVKSVGSITGIVAAAGGLGGYFPPLVMGATYDEANNNYTLGLLLLVATALIALGYTALRLHAHEPTPQARDGTAT